MTWEAKCVSAFLGGVLPLRKSTHAVIQQRIIETKTITTGRAKSIKKTDFVFFFRTNKAQYAREESNESVKNMDGTFAG